MIFIIKTINKIFLFFNFKQFQYNVKHTDREADRQTERKTNDTERYRNKQQTKRMAMCGQSDKWTDWVFNYLFFYLISRILLQINHNQILINS